MKETTHDQSKTTPSLRRRVVRVTFLSLLVAGAATLWFCRDPLRNLIFEKGVMLNDAPTEEAMESLVSQAKNPQTAIRALWSSRKIVHREAAIRQLPRFIPAGEPVPVQLESVVLDVW